MTKGLNMFYLLHYEQATIEFDLGRGADACRIIETGKDTQIIKPEAGDGYLHETQYVVQCVLKGKRPCVVHCGHYGFARN